ncbi:class I SAM-dependent methyltransferase [Sinomonas sp. ASV322]|uniref:class I SAM-dependent methyltransferase n=1 Tax=Sinomonas sp. ASV322 TaxID=3041920 RepID=UPI0027DE1709|nr:class I SAM-dependent methyltransferase [Sinomonas sp. ASV322]MDQ4501444.1 class I SAM-dependent methyltransferase [Sinomonas sp. ASV322]
MMKFRPTNVEPPQRDYVPAAGRDALLPFYDVFTAAFGAGTVHRTLIDRARIAPGNKVLEIGCGTGNLTIRAIRAAPNAEVIGTDPDPRALAIARRKARGLTGISFDLAYAQRLPYPDASFDRVLSSLMLHHLDEDARAQAAAEIRRVLRPGGSAHLVDFTGQAHGVHGFLSSRLNSAHLTDPGQAGIQELLANAGLECTEVTSERLRIMGEVTYYLATRPS